MRSTIAFPVAAATLPRMRARHEFVATAAHLVGHERSLGNACHLHNDDRENRVPLHGIDVQEVGKNALGLVLVPRR